ncbi:hypothetical protein ACOSQ4_016222 [Xanthoceras sorbifolium]
MLSFRVLVRYGNEIADLSYLEPGDCSVVNIINDVRKEIAGKGVQLFDNWKLDTRLFRDEELMIAIEAFDSHLEDKIELEINLEPVGVEYPEEPIGLLTFNNETPPASPNNVAHPATIEEYDSDEDDSYEVDEETGEDSEVNLNEELCE